MRLPVTAHSSRPWRIHELTRDFRLEDVWRCRRRAVRTISRCWSGSPRATRRTAHRAPPRAVGDPVEARRAAGVGRRRRGRRRQGADAARPAARDLRDGQRGPEFDSLPSPRSTCSRTSGPRRSPIGRCTGSCTSAGYPDEHGGYRGQMAVLVKPNGLLGNAYMAAITPFRHLLVYPAAMRQMERAWRAVGRSE